MDVSYFSGHRVLCGYGMSDGWECVHLKFVEVAKVDIDVGEKIVAVVVIRIWAHENRN